MMFILMLAILMKAVMISTMTILSLFTLWKNDEIGEDYITRTMTMMMTTMTLAPVTGS